MKIIVASLLILIFCSTAIAQSNDRVIIYDPVVNRNMDYPARPVISYKENSMFAPIQQSSSAPFTTVTRINRLDTGDEQVERQMKKHSPVKKKTLVLINQKIYTIEDLEFRMLDPNSILEVEIIKDEQSKTEIDRLIIIKTRQ